MANRPSAIKRIRQIERRTARNTSWKSRVRSQLRKFDEAVNSGDKEAVESALFASFSMLDKAAAKGIIHKNAAARKKSTMVKRMNKVSAS